MRLDFLEGIRGVTALYVVIFHVVHGFLDKPQSWLGKLAFRLTAFGHDAVAVFIVLSGFCLCLSVLGRQAETKLDIKEFFRRRAKRILPPYFATLAVSLVLIGTIPILGSEAKTFTIWDDTHPAFAVPSLLSHFLLVHNWEPALKFTINGPLWSVATEWQIYLLFPAFFLPVRRRFGALALLGLSLALGYGLYWLMPVRAAAAITWYIPLFALGMSACFAFKKEDSVERKWLSKLPLMPAAYAVTCVVALVGITNAQLWFRHQPLSDLVVGVTAALMVAALALESAKGRKPWIGRGLSHPLIAAIGHMSYSLYLTHLPLVALVALGFRREFGQSSPWLVLLVSLTLSLAFSVAFYWVVERPLLTRVSPRERGPGQTTQTK